MYNKSLSIIACAALAVLSASCSKESVTGSDGEAGISFTIEVPGAPATKAIGDGETATKLYYQVFDENGAPVDGLGVQNTTLTGKTATVNFQLVKEQTYSFVFWAQTAADGYYTIDGTEGLKKITANYTDKKSNDENFDAFYAVKTMEVTGPVSETVELKRPFAQINIATEGTISAGTTTKDIDFTDAASTVTVKGIPTVFSPLAATTDIFSGEAEEVTFTEAAAPDGNITVNGKDYKYLAVNYVFAPTDGTVYDLSASLKVEGKSVSLSVPAVPAKQNWRTNIVGDLLTSGADFTVVVDSDFEGNEDLDLVNIKNEASLKALFSVGGSATIQSDLEISKFTIPAGVSVSLNLNGKNVTVKGDDRGIASTISGELSISGDGSFGDPTPGGKYVGYLFYLAKGGKLNVEGNATFQCGLSCIQLSGTGAEANIAGGVWIGGDYGGKYWTINKIDGVKDSTTVKVSGGQFYGFNPADGKTENPNENWLADGYTVTASSYDETAGVTIYSVVKATSSATDEDSLETGLSKSGAAVTLSNDVEVSYLSVSKKATLNLNGATINCTGDESLRASSSKGNLSIVGKGSIKATAVLPDKQTSALSVRQGGTLNVYDGVTVDGGSGSNGNYAVRIMYGTVNIYGGYFHSGLDKDGNSSEVIYLESGFGASWKATLNIYGGVFECDGDAKFLINMQDSYRSKCSAKIYGGTFVGFNPADNTAEGEHTSFVAEGYKSVETTYNGKQAWKVEKE